MLVDNPIAHARRKDLQRLQKLDDRIAIARRHRLKCPARFVGLTRVREYRLPERGEQTMVKERRLVGGSPEPLRQEAAVAVADSRRPLRLVLIQRFARTV